MQAQHHARSFFTNMLLNWTGRLTSHNHIIINFSTIGMILQGMLAQHHARSFFTNKLLLDWTGSLTSHNHQFSHQVWWSFKEYCSTYLPVFTNMLLLCWFGSLTSPHTRSHQFSQQVWWWWRCHLEPCRMFYLVCLIKGRMATAQSMDSLLPTSATASYMLSTISSHSRRAMKQHGSSSSAAAAATPKMFGITDNNNNITRNYNNSSMTRCVHVRSYSAFGRTSRLTRPCPICSPTVRSYHHHTGLPQGPFRTRDVSGKGVKSMDWWSMI